MRFLSRVFSICVALIGLLWVFRVGSVAFDPSPSGMRGMTERLLDGAEFDPGVLARYDAALSKAVQRDLCVPEELKALSMIRLTRAQMAYIDRYGAASRPVTRDDAPRGAIEKLLAAGANRAKQAVGDAPSPGAAPTSGVPQEARLGSSSGSDASASSGPNTGPNPVARSDSASDTKSGAAAGGAAPVGTAGAALSAAEEKDHQAQDAALKERLNDLAYVSVVTLYCSPYQSLGWTILALGEFLANGHTPRLDGLIDFSYRTGPFDGWPLARRLDLLVSIAPNLSPAQAAMLKEQITTVVNSDLHVLLALVYLQQDDAHRALLRTLFSDLSARDQDLVAKAVRRAGSDVDLPLATPRGARPWDG